MAVLLARHMALPTARAPPTASTLAPLESHAIQSVRTARVPTGRVHTARLRTESIRMPRRSILTATHVRWAPPAARASLIRECHERTDAEMGRTASPRG